MFDEFFNELMFGSGAWFGLILIIAIVIIVTAHKKISGVLFMPITIFIGIYYLQHLESNNMFIWGAIMMFITSIYCLGISIDAALK